MRKVSYVNAVENIMYVMMCTRPNIYYTIGLISRYQSNPGSQHWKAVKGYWGVLKAQLIISYVIKEIIWNSEII